MLSSIINNHNVLFIFYHIEKCAGTSLRYELYNYFSKFLKNDLIFMPEKNNIGKNINLTNNDLIKIRQLGSNFIRFIYEKQIILCHISFNDKMFHFISNFKMTCIRNPINRVISHYNFFDRPHTKKEFNQLTNEEFNQWFEQKGNLTIYRLTNGKNNLLLAKKNLLKMNHVVIVEEYNKDIKSLGFKLHKFFKHEFVCQNEKKNIHKHKKITYSTFFIQKIINKLQDELELYYFYKNCRKSFNNLIHK